MHAALCVVRKTWADAKATPKDLLEKKLRGRNVTYRDVESASSGHLAHLAVGEDIYQPVRAYAIKKDAQQNAALMALHCIECDTVVE